MKLNQVPYATKDKSVISEAELLQSSTLSLTLLKVAQPTLTHPYDCFLITLTNDAVSVCSDHHSVEWWNPQVLSGMHNRLQRRGSTNTEKHYKGDEQALWKQGESGKLNTVQ